MGKIKDILVQIKLNDPLLTKLNLQHSHITNENIIEITEALKLNTTITDIKLNFNYIGDIGAQALATFLNDNKKITSIELTPISTFHGLINSSNCNGGLPLFLLIKTQTVCANTFLVMRLVKYHNLRALTFSIWNRSVN